MNDRRHWTPDMEAKERVKELKIQVVDLEKLTLWHSDIEPPDGAIVIAEYKTGQLFKSKYENLHWYIWALGHEKVYCWQKRRLNNCPVKWKYYDGYES